MLLHNYNFATANCNVNIYALPWSLVTPVKGSFDLPKGSQPTGENNYSKWRWHYIPLKVTEGAALIRDSGSSYGDLREDCVSVIYLSSIYSYLVELEAQIHSLFYKMLLVMIYYHRHKSKYLSLKSHCWGKEGRDKRFLRSHRLTSVAKTANSGPTN